MNTPAPDITTPIDGAAAAVGYEPTPKPDAGNQNCKRCGQDLAYACDCPPNAVPDAAERAGECVVNFICNRMQTLGINAFMPRPDEVAELIRAELAKDAGAVEPDEIPLVPSHEPNMTISHLVVFSAEGHQEITPFSNANSARQHYDKLTGNWSDVYFCEVIMPYQKFNPLPAPTPPTEAAREADIKSIAEEIAQGPYQVAKGDTRTTVDVYQRFLSGTMSILARHFPARYREAEVVRRFLAEVDSSMSEDGSEYEYLDVIDEVLKKWESADAN